MITPNSTSRNNDYPFGSLLITRGFIVVIILFFTCCGIKAQLTVKSNSDSMKSNCYKVGKIVNEKKEGAWIYYRGETIYRISYFTNDTLHGNTTLFYGNGKVKTQIEIINGKVEGEVKFYSMEGELIAIYLYKNDLFVSVLDQKVDKDSPIKGHSLILLED